MIGGEIDMLKLTSVIKITEIKHKSFTKAFKNVKVNDVLELSIEIKNRTRTYGKGINATYIAVKNYRTQSINEISMSNCAEVLPSCFGYVELTQGN